MYGDIYRGLASTNRSKYDERNVYRNSVPTHVSEDGVTNICRNSVPTHRSEDDERNIVVRNIILLQLLIYELIHIFPGRTCTVLNDRLRR